jgi:hypothetical protein
MRCGILRGNDLHTYRLFQGLRSCGIESVVIQDENIPKGAYDIVFVDPSFPRSVSHDMGSKIIFFDCEDDPRHFDPGEAYYSLKDHVEFYAKMVYVEDDRKDGIKNIAFPIQTYLGLRNFAKSDLSNVPYSFDPVFIGVPTWANPDSIVDGGAYSFDEEQDIHSVVTLPEEEITDGGSNIRYNQRVDWLLSMEKSGIHFEGGLVFKEDDCYSQDFVSNLFGKGVRKWAHDPISYQQNLMSIIQNKVALCPTGHDRISWRTFDIMAAGSILFWTDVEDRKMLYMPKSFVKVKDGDNLGECLQEHEKYYEELLGESRRNSELMSSLTPEVVKKDFLHQLD